VPIRFLKNPCLSLLLNTLAACAALNVDQIDKLSRLDPSKTDPADLRVALVVPKELVLRRGDASLGHSRREDGGSSDNQDYALEVREGGVSDVSMQDHPSSGETLYVLALSGADAKRLRVAQGKATRNSDGRPRERDGLSVNVSGGCWRGHFPAGRKVMVNAWMQAARGTDYFPLLSNHDLMQGLKSAKVTALPACAI
jgi:hypothetical protein